MNLDKILFIQFYQKKVFIFVNVFYCEHNKTFSLAKIELSKSNC